MRQTITRIECDGCGDRIEAVHIKKRCPPAMQAVDDEAETRGWWQNNGTDWCPRCKRSAKLAVGVEA